MLELGNVHVAWVSWASRLWREEFDASEAVARSSRLAGRVVDVTRTLALVCVSTIS